MTYTPITFHDQRPTHPPLTYEQELRARAGQLWHQADESLEDGDPAMCKAIQAAAVLLEGFADRRARMPSPLDARLNELNAAMYDQVAEARLCARFGTQL